MLKKYHAFLLPLIFVFTVYTDTAQAQGQWQDLPDMGIIPWAHTPVVQADGKVLIACAYYVSRDSESYWTMPKKVLRFNPQTLAWESLPDLPIPSIECAPALLKNGNILVTGGETNDYSVEGRTDQGYIPRTYFYSAANKNWQRLADMPQPLFKHSAIELADGRVLVIGGTTGLDFNQEDQSPYVNSSKVISYNFTNDTWQELAPLNTARSNHQSYLLTDGRVLIAGGDLDCIDTSSCAYAEIYDSKTNQWAAYPIPQSDTGTNWGATSVALYGQQLYVIGAHKASEERYHTIRENILPLMSLNLETGVWQEHPGWPANGHIGASIAALPDGRILLTGGYYLLDQVDEMQVSDAVYLYNPATQTWQADKPLEMASTHHAMTALKDGRVLITGGLTPWEGSGQPDEQERALLFTPESL